MQSPVELGSAKVSELCLLCLGHLVCLFPPCPWGLSVGSSTPGAGGAWQQDLDGGGTYGDDASCGDLVPQEHQE